MCQIGTILPQKIRYSPIQFLAHVYCGQKAGWIKMPLGSRYGGRPQPRRHCVLVGDPYPPPKRGRIPSSIFGPCLLQPNSCMDQDATWYRGRPWPRRYCVRWGPSSTLPKKGAEHPHQFSAHVYCDQTAGWIKMALDMEVGFGSGHIVLDWHPAPLPKRGHSPQFSAHVYCDQTSVCIRMPIGTEVGLSLGDNVLHGDPASLP